MTEEQAGWASEAEVAAQVRKANPGMPDANVATHARYDDETGRRANRVEARSQHFPRVRRH